MKALARFFLRYHSSDNPSRSTAFVHLLRRQVGTEVAWNKLLNVTCIFRLMAFGTSFRMRRTGTVKYLRVYLGFLSRSEYSSWPKSPLGSLKRSFRSSLSMARESSSCRLKEISKFWMTREGDFDFGITDRPWEIPQA